MKTYSAAIAGFESASEKQPHFVFELAWNLAEIGNTYFTSSASAATPAAADVIASSFVSVSGQTQRIRPDVATSEIGSITVKLLDVAQQITNKLGAELVSGTGLRGKVARLYVGYSEMAFADYDLRITYLVDAVTYRDGVYTVTLSDIQRQARQKIFSGHETNLLSSVIETDLFIPVATADTTLFPTFEHGAEYTTRPGETVGYAKLNDEVFSHRGIIVDGVLGVGFDVIKRGELNTRALSHTVDSTTETNRRPKITEHIYIEGAAPKIIYALLTGEVANQTGDMPAHWHLGIRTDFVKLTDFQALGDDFWNTTDDSGRFVRIENPGSQDGKRYIEKELLLWLGAFMPIYADGSIGIKRLRQILADSSYNVYLDASNIKSYSDLRHDMQSVINDIEIDWNWVDSKEDFTKTSKLIDATSISTHGQSDLRRFAFKTVHTGLHTDEDVLTYVDVMRDRYSGPPLVMSVQALPSLSNIEVGDTVKVALDQIRDFTTSSSLNRVFEVQQVTTNWMTGSLSLSLFGSSQKPGAQSRTSLSAVLDNEFYTQEGTDLASVLTIVAGGVTTNATLTGHATDVSQAIYYYDGDLTINPGVTITITENVQLRIKGSLQINGTIDGAGNGATGGAATTLFSNGLTTQTFNIGIGYTSQLPIDYDEGEAGYFGTALSARALLSVGIGSGTPPPSHSQVLVDTLFQRSESAGESSVPFYQLTNNTTADTLTGYPIDLRGNAGPGGMPYIHQAWALSGLTTSVNVATIRGNGGAGGDGGAGLLIITRGMAFGGSGLIDLSGGDSSLGTAYTHTTGDKFYGSSGAPGAPGALLVLFDGNATNPDIDDTVFIANYGDAPVPVGAVEVGTTDFIDSGLNPVTIGNWPFGDALANKAPDQTTENISATGSAHRFIFIPPDEAIEQEEDPQPADVTGFVVLQNGELVVFKWNPNPDVLLAGFEVRFGPRGNTSFDNATPLTQVTKGTSVTSADVPPGDWTFYCAGVNNSVVRQYSENPASADLVVTTALDIITQQAQAPAWVGTLDNFVLHHTGVLVPKSQNLASADGWDTFDVFVMNPYATCTYTAPEIDIDFDDEVRVWGDIESALGPGEIGIANPSLSIDYRLDAGSYDGFESWGIGEATLRYVKHKLTLTTADGVAKITGFKPTVDSLEHTQSAKAVAIAASGGSSIVFSPAFHNAPFVRVFVDATSALIPVRTNVTATGFDVQVFNSSGADVGGNVDWEATGI